MFWIRIYLTADTELVEVLKLNNEGSKTFLKTEKLGNRISVKKCSDLQDLDPCC